MLSVHLRSYTRLGCSQLFRIAAVTSNIRIGCVVRRFYADPPEPLRDTPDLHSYELSKRTTTPVAVPSILSMSLDQLSRLLDIPSRAHFKMISNILTRLATIASSPPGVSAFVYTKSRPSPVRSPCSTRSLLSAQIQDRFQHIAVPILYSSFSRLYGRQLSSSLHALQKLDWELPDALFQSIALRLGNPKLSMNSMDVGMGLVALVKLSRDPGLSTTASTSIAAGVNSMIERATALMPHMKARTIANCSWAVASMDRRRSNTELIRPFMLAVAIRVMLRNVSNDLSLQELSNIVWAFSKFRYRHVTAINALDRQAVSLLESCPWKELSAKDVHQLLFSFASLCISPSDVLRLALIRRLPTVCPSFDEQSLANCAWALAQLHMADPTLVHREPRSERVDGDFVAAFQALEICVLPHLPRLETRHFANLAWAFSAVWRGSDALFDEIATRAIALAESCDARILAQLLFTFRNRDIGERFWSLSLSRVIQLAPKMTPLDIQSTSRILARDTPDRRAWKSLVERAITLLKNDVVVSHEGYMVSSLLPPVASADRPSKSAIEGAENQQLLSSMLRGFLRRCCDNPEHPFERRFIVSAISCLSRTNAPASDWALVSHCISTSKQMQVPLSEYDSAELATLAASFARVDTLHENLFATIQQMDTKLFSVNMISKVLGAFARIGMSCEPFASAAIAKIASQPSLDGSAVEFCRILAASAALDSSADIIHQRVILDRIAHLANTHAISPEDLLRLHIWSLWVGSIGKRVGSTSEAVISLLDQAKNVAMKHPDRYQQPATRLIRDTCASLRLVSSELHLGELALGFVCPSSYFYLCAALPERRIAIDIVYHSWHLRGTSVLKGRYTLRHRLLRSVGWKLVLLQQESLQPPDSASYIRSALERALEAPARPPITA